MTFEEALKAIQKKGFDEPHFLLTLSYSTKLVLPYKEGLSIADNLRKAEVMTDSYSNPQILPLPKDQISITVLPHEDYCRYKVAQLLGITYDDACRLEKAPQTEAA